jgi:hypothetical protein
MDYRVNFHDNGYRCTACSTDVATERPNNNPPVVYIIGRTTNMPQLNLTTFNAVEGFLHKYGYETLKQHDIFEDSDHHHLTQQEAMQRRFEAMDQCDMVVLLPDWMECSYARAEQRYARTMQMDLRNYTIFCASHTLCKSTPKASVQDLKQLIKQTAAA